MRQPFSDASNDIQTATKAPEHTKATPEPPSEQSEKSNG